METTHPAGNPKEGIEADEEARNIWLQYLPPERVLPFAAKDNFWEMGETGNCPRNPFLMSPNRVRIVRARIW